MVDGSGTYAPIFRSAGPRRILRGIWLCLLLGLLLSGLSTRHVGAAEHDELLLGMSAAFTGPNKALGIELYRGSMAYFEHINRQGGIHGRPVRILTADDGYNPTPAIENTLLFLQKQVLALFNYVGTPTVTRVLPLLNLYKSDSVYLFFPFSGAQPQREAPYEYRVFNFRASYRQETEGLVNHLLGVGRSRIAVFYQADAYGRSGWDGVRRALAAHGLQIATEATYSRGASFDDSMRPQVEIIQTARPDAVIAVGTYAACAAFIRDARDAGLDVPIANLSFVGSEHLLMLLQEAGAQSGRDYTLNCINSQVVPSYEDLSLPAVREYRQLMESINPSPPAEFDNGDHQTLQYSFVSFEGYFNARVMTEVLRRLGPEPSCANLPAAVIGIDNLDVGIDTPVHFSDTQHQGLNTVYYTTVENGTFVPIRDWSAWQK